MMRRTLVALTSATVLIPAAPALAQTAPDVTAPQLTSFVFSPQTVDVTNGPATVNYTACVTDETAHTRVSVTFDSDATTQSQFGTSDFLTTGTRQNGCYTNGVVIPRGAAPGTWTPVIFPLTDTVGNSDSFVNVPQKLTVINGTTTPVPPPVVTPPVVQPQTTLRVTPVVAASATSAPAGSTVTLTVLSAPGALLAIRGEAVSGGPPQTFERTVTADTTGRAIIPDVPVRSGVNRYQAMQIGVGTFQQRDLGAPVFVTGITATPTPTPTPTTPVPVNIDVDATVIDYGDNHLLAVFGRIGARADLYGNGRLIRQGAVLESQPGEPNGIYLWELEPGHRTVFHAVVDGQRTKDIVVRVRRSVSIGTSQARGVYTFTGTINRREAGVQVTVARLDAATKRVTGVASARTNAAGNYTIRTGLPVGQAGYYALTGAQSGLESGRSRLYGLIVPLPAPAAVARPVVTASRPVAPRPAAPRPVAVPQAYYANCDAVRAAGRAPLYRGQVGYRAGLDRDNDGVACE